MQNEAAMKAIEDLIEHHWQVVAALEKARDLMRGGAGRGLSQSIPDKPRALPPPRNVAAPRTGRPSTKSFDFVQDIDGVAFSCTEQQHAFVELLGEHDFVTTEMAVVLWDNKMPAFWAALKQLRGFMVEAGVQAAIVSHPGTGYRLEAFNTAEAEA
jgi:hypothetical protein